MQGKELTKTFIKELLVQRDNGTLFKTGQRQVEFWDKELSGFLIIVGKKRISYYVQATVNVSDSGNDKKYKTLKKKIGKYPDVMPSEMRKTATTELGNIREFKIEYKIPPPTFRNLVTSFLSKKTTKNKKAPLCKETKLGYESQVLGKFKDILDLPLPEVLKILTPAEVLKRHQDIIVNCGPTAALNTFNRLRAVFNFGAGEYPNIVTHNPIHAITKAGAWTKSAARSTMLKSSKEFKIFREAISTLPQTHIDCFLFAYYHGLRPIEAVSLRWQDIDFDFWSFDQSWMSSETKHRSALPLSRQSMAILKKREADRGPNDTYVFPSVHTRSKSGHIILRADKLRRITGLDLTPHSLRRTFTMVAEHLLVSREDINRLTNHRAGSVVDIHYLVDISLKKARKPLQLTADKLEALLLGSETSESLFYENVSDLGSSA